METIFLKPAKGMLIRMENASRYIDPDGEDLPNTSYYRRRRNDGDLMIAKRPAQNKD